MTPDERNAESSVFTSVDSVLAMPLSAQVFHAWRVIPTLAQGLRDAQAEVERLTSHGIMVPYPEWEKVCAERDALTVRLAEVEKERDVARKRGAEISAHMGIVLDERDGARNVLAGLTDIQRDVEAEQRRADAAEAKLAALREEVQSWPDGNERASEYAAARGQ